MFRIRSLVALVACASLVAAQEMQGSCLRLLGSSACPGFQTAYLNPSNLSNAFPFFSEVDSVASFDAAAFRYFSDPFQYQATKFERQLGCTNATNAVIRYSRTVMCSMWVNQQWSIACTALYDGQSAATSSKMVCQKTCLEYAFGEADIINSQQYCPGPDLTGGTRIGNVTKDYAQCTNWVSLATNNSDSCVLGSINEGNCGYGPSTSQLCNHCQGSNPDDCCYDSNTDVSTCGYVLTAKGDRPGSSTSSSSSASPSGTSASGNSSNTVGSTGLSKGALAGIIVGSVLGGLLLLALLIGLCLCLRKRRNHRNNNRDSGSSYPDSSMAPTPSAGIFARNPPAGTSEKGLLGPGASRTTVGAASTLYSHGAHGEKSPKFPSTSAAAAALPVGARANGVVLPRVRDENQGGNRWIVSGSEVAVLWPYQASLPDELDLRPGMKIKVLRLYDDAWGTGQDLETGHQGAFPIVCVTENLNLTSSVTPTPPSSTGT